MVSLQIIEYYSYDTHGSLISYTQYNREEPSHLWLCITNNKYEYSYNSKGLIDTLSLFYFDFLASMWVNDYKAEYSFDDNGKPSISIYQIIDSAINRLSFADKIGY